MTAAHSPIARPLALPFTGQVLRLAIERRDLAPLLDCAAQLRVAGFRVDAQALAHELLANGCASVVDAFGQRVALQVHVPPARPQHLPDPGLPFRMAA